MCKIKKILLGFLIIYSIVLVFNLMSGIVIDEGAHSMDSLFFYYFLKDFFSNPNILFNLEDYVFRFYSYYPAIYIIQYPPLYNIVSLCMFWLFGINIFSIRFTTIIFSLLSLVVLYYLGKELYNKKIAFLSVLILAFAPYFFFYSSIAMKDIPMLFFILLSIYFFYKGVEHHQKYFYYFAFVLGLGFLTKQHSIILIPPLMMYLFYRKKFRKNIYNIIKAGIIFLATASPFLVVMIFYGSGLHTYWLTEAAEIKCPICHTINFFTHFYFYPLMLFYMIFPLVFLIPIFYFIFKRDFKKENALLLLIIIFYFVIYTIIPLKIDKSIIPTLPMFSLLFVYTLMKQKKYFYFIFSVISVSQLIMVLLFFPPWWVVEQSKQNYDLRDAAKYINENIVENASVFLMPNFDNAGFLFNFARSNSFKNHVFRWRDCIFENITEGVFREYIEDNSIYYIVIGRQDNTKFLQFIESLEIPFKEVRISGNILIYESSKKQFDKLERVCQYNCHINKEICFQY